MRRRRCIHWLVTVLLIAPRMQLPPVVVLLLLGVVLLVAVLLVFLLVPLLLLGRGWLRALPAAGDAHYRQLRLRHTLLQHR